MREIEIKLKVKDLDFLEKELEKAGCAFSEPITQHDVIYSAKSIEEEFDKSKEGDVIIRIRKQNGRAELNLKKQKTYEMDNLEYETEIKDPEEMHQILLILGWKPQIEVKKIRKKGKLGNYNICLDKVEKLGEFVEIEKITDDNDDPQVVRKELFDIAKQFGFMESDEETRGYDTQIYQLERKNSNKK